MTWNWCAAAAMCIAISDGPAPISIRLAPLQAAKIIHILDERKLSTRDAEKLTGVSYSEFSRIRNTQLGRFTLDRMIAILGKLDKDIEVSVTFTVRKSESSWHIACGVTQGLRPASADAERFDAQ